MISFCKKKLATFLAIIFLSLITSFYSDSAEAGFVAVNPFTNINGCIETTWKVYNTRDSTAFNPKIRVYNRVVILCFGWEDTITINNVGDCVWFGIIRACARQTAPCKNGNDFCCGAGCAKSQNNSSDYRSNGFNDPGSTSCPDCALKPATRLCAFEDPMFPADPNDNKPSSMPFHEKTPVSPLLNMTQSTTILLAAMVVMLVVNPMMAPIIVLAGAIAWGVMQLVSFITSTINYTVIRNVGCVDLPLAPYPPPHTPDIAGFVPQPSIIPICSISLDYPITPSDQISMLAGGATSTQVADWATSYALTSANLNTLNNQQAITSADIANANYKQIPKLGAFCEPGGANVYSSFSRPLVRIYFENPLPICPAGFIQPIGSSGGALDSNVCIKYNANNVAPNYWPTNSSATYIWSNYQNLLSPCSNGINCFTFSSGSNAGNTNYRAYYQYTDPITNKVENTDFAFFPPDSKINITLAGIHYSNYKDASFVSSVSKIYDITDYMKLTRKFSTQAEGTNICVYENYNTTPASQIACFNRPNPLPPIVKQCIDNPSSSGSGCVSVSSCSTSDQCNYLSETDPAYEPRILLNIDDTYKNQVIGVELNASNSSSSSKPPSPICATSSSNKSPAPCTIGGANIFSAYVTDQFNSNPSSSPTGDGSVDNSFKGSFDSSTDTWFDDKFTYKKLLPWGIVFHKGSYCYGSNHICLDMPITNIEKVIAKIIYSKDNSGKSADTVSTDIRDRIIPPYDPTADSQALTGIPTYDPLINNVYSSKDTYETVYGYKDSSSGKNIPNPYCNSNGISCVVATPDTSSSSTPAPTLSSKDLTVTVPITCTSTIQGVTSSYTNNQCTIAFLQKTSNPNITAAGYKANNGATSYIDWSTKKTVNFDLYITDPTNPANGKLQFGSRPLTPMELGLCVPTLPPSCPQDGPSIKSGFINWPKTQVNYKVTAPKNQCEAVGTFSNPTSKPPSRNCKYIQNGTLASGCPNMTVQWDEVKNPCVIYTPSWWPSNFLASTNPISSKYLGAIINQFSISYNYQNCSSGTCVVPKASNRFISTSESIEPWNTPGGENTCYKDNGTGTGNYARNNKDGDQEMLYLTASQWAKLWTVYQPFWLLAPSNDNNFNGCYVYDLVNYPEAESPLINVEYTNVQPGMKICKYQDKVSFSLVDLKANSATDYKNTAYIMQSNIVNYNSFRNLTTINNAKNNGDNLSINHGIVVQRSAFPNDENNHTHTNVTVATVPEGFKPISTPESLTVAYNFAHQYQGKYKCRCKAGNFCETCHKYCTTYYNSNGTQASNGDGNYIPNFAGKTASCALSILRNNINYSSTSDNRANVYLANSPKFTSIWLDRSCRKSDQVDRCYLPVFISGYTAGNSAAYPHMFLWKGPNSYSVCNGPQ